MYVRATSTRFSRGMSMPAIRAIRSALPLLVLWIGANDHPGPVAADHLAVVATGLHRGADFQQTSFALGAGYFSRYVIRPRVRSYGDNSTRTRSPGRIRMKFIRSFPLIWARTRWPFSSSTANIVFGSGSRTVPSTSIASFLPNVLPGVPAHGGASTGADTRTHSVPTAADSGKRRHRPSIAW